MRVKYQAMSRNIAIFGRFCAGKTTLATELADSYGYVPVSMAANMKWIVKQVYGTIDKSEQVNVITQDGDVREITIRQALQGVGERMKEIDRDFWLKWFLSDCEAIPPDYPLVMDDARMLFEADVLRERGWLLVRLTVPEGVRAERHLKLYGRYPTDIEKNHPTETQVDGITPDIDLDGTRPAEELADILVAYS